MQAVIPKLESRFTITMRVTRSKITDVKEADFYGNKMGTFIFFYQNWSPNASTNDCFDVKLKGKIYSCLSF